MNPTDKGIIAFNSFNDSFLNKYIYLLPNNKNLSGAFLLCSKLIWSDANIPFGTKLSFVINLNLVISNSLE